MPTDLTGTPTPLGIGTYNTSADAPSGLGFNEAMSQIDSLLTARVVTPASLSYTPTWTGASGNPVLGNGSIRGQYSQVGKIVVAQFSIVMGSTTTFGSGNYTISVPVAPDSSLVAASDVYGGGIMYLAGDASPAQLRWRGDGRLVLADAGLSFVGSGSLAWASGAVIQGNLVYLAA